MNGSAHTLIIGVDGGGTASRAAVGTSDGGVLGRGDAGAANATTDLALAVRNVADAVEAAARDAGIPTDQLSSATAHIGIAGVLSAQDADRVAQALPYKHITVTDDRPTAVMGALGSSPGALLSVGTGTITALQRSDAMAFVGGWGFQVSDQGSGAWLGRATLERVLLCHDRMADHTALTRSVFSRFENDPNAISAFAVSAKGGDFAKFARDVVKHASDGDPWGRTIMKLGADHLVHGLTSLGFVPGQPLCLTGGIGPHYRQFLPDDCLAGYVEAKGTALDGAFALAKAHMNHPGKTP